MSDKIKQFMIGFRSLYVGLRLIRENPKIMKFAIIPFVLDFVILVGIFVWGGGQISGWVDQAMNWAFSNPQGFLWSLIYWPLFLLGWLTFLVCLFFLGYVVASLVAAPFNSLLAEKTLEELGVIETRKFNLARWLKTSVSMLWASLIKTAIFLVFGLLFFLISFVPVVGLLASFGLLMIMSFDSVDYSFEIFQYSAKKRFSYFRQNCFYFAGSGAALGLTLLIPGLNFLLFPVAVVGSADLMRQQLAAAER